VKSGGWSASTPEVDSISGPGSESPSGGGSNPDSTAEKKEHEQDRE
jgi:hypothetical protein